MKKRRAKRLKPVFWLVAAITASVLIAVGVVFILFGNRHKPAVYVTPSSSSKKGPDDQYAFRADGTFTWSVHSDYVDTYEGRWKLAPAKGGVVLYTKPDSATRHGPRVSRLADGADFPGLGKISLGTIGTDANFKNNLTTIAYIRQDFPAYNNVVGKQWQKAGDQDSEFRPMYVTLYEDATYDATFLSGCTHTGPWALEQDLGKFSFEFEDYSYCDTRQPFVPGYATDIQFDVTALKLTDPEYDYNSYLLVVD
jgi:hypothetical protein